MMNYTELIESIGEMVESHSTLSLGYSMISQWLIDHDIEEGDTMEGDVKKFAFEVANIAFNDGYEQGKNSSTCPDCPGVDRQDIENMIDDALVDPSRWYVLDKNGERVHIGDYIKFEDKDKKIIGLGNNELFSNFWNGSPATAFEKVIQDSVELIKDEMMEYVDIACDQYGISNTEPLTGWIDRLSAIIEKGE